MVVNADWEHAAQHRDPRTCGQLTAQGITKIMLVGDSRIRMLFEDLVRMLNESKFEAGNIEEDAVDGIPSQCASRRFRYQHADVCTATQKLSTPHRVCNGPHVGWWEWRAGRRLPHFYLWTSVWSS